MPNQQKTYSAGSLQLNVMGMSQNAVTSIDSTIKSLNRLNSALKRINNAPVLSSANTLSMFFTKMSQATKNIDTTAIDRLSSSAKALSSISRISNLEKMDFAKVSSGFSQLATAIDPFLQKVKSSEASLVSLDAILKRVGGKSFGNLATGTSNAQPNGFLRAASWSSVILLARRLGRIGADLVQAGSDYTETLNLWQVAMRGNLDLADEFISKMNRAYGISEETLMRSQATFKNMIGSLGQISDEVSYKISESLVQMSLDFASLYNASIESAFSKMEAMLAGQVRPIRGGGAGLDITESTLYQFYKELGGEKSVRQLNRTEKQLLSILAVYRQMGSAGALGDMSKTINSFANQSRAMTESWEKTKTWSGLLLKDLIESSGLLTFVNASLITLSTILESIARSKGLGEENFLDAIFTTVENTNEEVDNLQKKLLDFDKFRALNSSTDSALAIDTKLLEALGQYDSIIEKTTSEAQELAKTWLLFLGATEDSKGNLTFTGENLERIKNALSAIVVVVGVLVGVSLISGIRNLIASLGGLASVTSLLNATVVGGFIWAFMNFIDAIERGEAGSATLYGTLMLLSGIAFVKLNQQMLLSAVTAVKNFIPAILKVITNTKMMTSALMVGAGAFALLSFSKWADTEMSGAKRAVTSIMAVVGAVTALAVALKLLRWDYAGALTLASAVMGTVFTVSSAIPNFENGASDIDSGTVFRAGEFGKTEAVYTGSNGKTNVANVKQMEQAFYNALMRYSDGGSGNITIVTSVDGDTIFKTVTSSAKARGLTWAKS